MQGRFIRNPALGIIFTTALKKCMCCLTEKLSLPSMDAQQKSKLLLLFPARWAMHMQFTIHPTNLVRWLNFAVSKQKARGDAFDLGDNRVGATLDPVPVFVSGRLERQQPAPVNVPSANRNSMIRRVFGPEIFSTDWNHVDHLVIPADSVVTRQLEGMEEVYYIIKGNGTVAINNEKADIKSDETFFGLLGEKPGIANNGKEDLEVLVIGIAASKQKQLAINKPLLKPKA